MFGSKESSYVVWLESQTHSSLKSMVNSTDEINVILHLTLLEVIVNMLRNKMQLRTELIDYDQDQH